MRAAVVAVLIGIGTAASLSGTVGILRLPDVYLRIQASAKAVVQGALPVLAGLVVAKGPVSPYGARALIVAGLLIVMNPIASQALARAASKSGIRMWSGAVLDQPAERHARRSRRHQAGNDEAASDTAGKDTAGEDRPDERQPPEGR